VVQTGGGGKQILQFATQELALHEERMYEGIFKLQSNGRNAAISLLFRPEVE